MKRYILLLALIGCGEDASTTSSDDPSETTAQSFDEKAFLKEWEERCIDDNLPLIEAEIDDCINCPNCFGILHGDPVEECNERAEENTIRLEDAWEWAKSTAAAEYRSCTSDIRTYNEFCVGEYDSNISSYVSLKCQAAALWY